MARTRSAKVQGVKDRLMMRLQQGTLRPGERFLSARAVAAKYAISYQTAHRLIAELEAEGFVQRRAASGTYVAGESTTPENAPLAGVQLIFNARARRRGSFGARLLRELKTCLQEHEVTAQVTYWSERSSIAAGRFPVIWECPQAVTVCVEAGRRALLLNEKPPPGVEATLLDSVSSDDFSGGVCAAQVLLRTKGRPRQISVLSGPAGDVRSEQRCAGFLSLLPHASVVVPGGWFYEDGQAVAPEVVRAGRDGIFCCNDRLAEGVIDYCRGSRVLLPPLVGFDDAPVAAQLDLTTIALPWREMMAGATSIIKRRLSGDNSSARQLIFPPHPIMRRL